MNSTVEIINIGDELLYGHVVNTNSAWLGRELGDIGLPVVQVSTVSDSEKSITDALDLARKRAGIIIMTGGLGPTNDDVTKIALCKYFKSNLRFDEKSFLNIEQLFKKYGREVSATNRNQAMVPEKCTVIENPVGTAPGMWFEPGSLEVVSLPGVPVEMKQMMRNTVLPRLKSLYSNGVVMHKFIMTQGIPESDLADAIAGWESNLPPDIRLAYLPSAGQVRLRLSGYGSNSLALSEKLNTEADKLFSIIPHAIYGFDNVKLEEKILELMRGKNLTLSTAESCTGGYIAHCLTSVPGCSVYFKGSVVAYSNSIKTDLLQVPESLIQQHGVVSEQVVTMMAKLAKEKFKTDFSIATSGIAGPDGGSEEKPVGTIWFAIAHPSGIYSRQLTLGGNREHNIKSTAAHALNSLRQIITGEWT